MGSFTQQELERVKRNLAEQKRKEDALSREIQEDKRKIEEYKKLSLELERKNRVKLDEFKKISGAVGRLTIEERELSRKVESERRNPGTGKSLGGRSYF